MTVVLPELPSRELLTDLCKETADRERVTPAAVEKDLFLTRLIWALAQVFEEKLLLKGGTLLSKVDLGYHRMSEDVDMVLPLEGRGDYQPANARAMNKVRDALKVVAPNVGVTFSHPDGERSAKHSHVIWTLDYPSPFGAQGILVEVSRRPVLRPARRARLGQLLEDPLAGNYEGAYCWALDAREAHAEKVRAACTRNLGRDFFDLGLLVKTKADLSSGEFRALLDAKLAELQQPPLSDHSTLFLMTDKRRVEIEASLRKDLPAVVRLDEPHFDLDEVLQLFERRWHR